MIERSQSRGKSKRTSTNATEPVVSVIESESVRFLDRDYCQCFAQMRHYEQTIWDICKFTFTGYTAILGVAVALYKFPNNTSTELDAAALAVLSVGLLVGLCMYFLIIRNRIYFVVVARYVNEHRALFLRAQPLGFENKSRMYSDAAEPHFFSWNSSQLLVSYTVALLNSVLLAGIVVITQRAIITDVLYSALFSIGTLTACQVGPAVYVLKQKDRSKP